MKYTVLTLFPEMIESMAHTSIIGRAIAKGSIGIDTVNIRDFSANKHNRVDDYPYGGGAGMVMEAEPVCRAIESAKGTSAGRPRVIYLTPQGRVLDQLLVEELAREEELILLCGHYEGIDERVLEEEVDDYISIGDYVLTGGELGALVLIDAVSRFVPGVLGSEESAQFESHQDNLLEYPHYTRPDVWHGKEVPEVLLSGNHDRIEAWRHAESIARTKHRRPDLYARAKDVSCIFYGPDAGEPAGLLCAGVSRYGVLLDFNRKKLRKTHYSFGERDYLLIVASCSALLAGDVPENIPAPFTNMTGQNTHCFLILLVDTSEEEDSSRTSNVPQNRQSTLTGGNERDSREAFAISARTEAAKQAETLVRARLAKGFVLDEVRRIGMDLIRAEKFAEIKDETILAAKKRILANTRIS